MSLLRSYSRLWSIESGKVMVVSDLHGDWDAYQRYRERFLTLHQQGQVDYLVFLGDIVHRKYSPDDSLKIALDILALQEEFGDKVILLCGNHELPHIYRAAYPEEQRQYVPAFEQAMQEHHARDTVLHMFEALPFYIRTAAGITLTHAGASHHVMMPKSEIDIFEWEHEDFLEWADEEIEELDESSKEARCLECAQFYEQESYAALMKHYFAMPDTDSPHYLDALRGYLIVTETDIDPLWDALSARCEEHFGIVSYGMIAAKLLQKVSQDYTPQHALVAGHKTVTGGYQLIGTNHFRLASAKNATPREEGLYLIFDAGQPSGSLIDISDGLDSVFT